LDKITDEMWVTFSEEEDPQISSVIIEMEELPYTYKNYIYRGKNWKCPVCNADEGHCEHYYYILCEGIHHKDQAYKMRLSQQCKCLDFSESNSKEGKNAYQAIFIYNINLN